MKNKVLAFISLMLLLTAFSFNLTTGEKRQVEYVWFQVKPGTELICWNFTTLSVNDLVPIPQGSSSNPLQDLRTSGAIMTLAQAIATFGCPVTELYVCAVGYGLVSSNFQLVVIDGVSCWLPVPTATVLAKICRPSP